MSNTLQEMTNALNERSSEMFTQARQFGPLYWATALCGEAGEIANKIKKNHRDRTELDLEDLGGEFADTLAYILFFCDHLNIDITKAFVDKYNEISLRNGSDFTMFEQLGGVGHYRRRNTVPVLEESNESDR